MVFENNLKSMIQSSVSVSQYWLELFWEQVIYRCDITMIALCSTVDDDDDDPDEDDHDPDDDDHDPDDDDVVTHG